MAIQKNVAVKVIGGFYDGKTGKVVNTFPNLDVAIVSFDDNGDVGKVSLSALVEIRPQANQETKSEIPEGAKKISRADFKDAIVRVTQPDFKNPGDIMDDIVHGLAAGIVGMDIAEKIFKDQDVVVMTEDDLVVALWDGCNPKNVSATAGNMFSIPESLHVSTGAIITLRKIVDILFGAENG